MEVKKREIVDFAFVDNTGRYSNVVEKGSEMSVKMKVLCLLTSFSYVLLRLKGFIPTVTPAPDIDLP